MGWETRREQRHPIVVQITVQVNPSMQETIHLAKETFQGQLVDISLHGLGLVSHTFLPKGVLVDLELPRSILSLPGKPPASGTMKITGQIVYTKSEGGQCRMGLVITHIDEKDRLLIQEFSLA